MLSLFPILAAEAAAQPAAGGLDATQIKLIAVFVLGLASALGICIPLLRRSSRKARVAQEQAKEVVHRAQEMLRQEKYDKHDLEMRLREAKMTVEERTHLADQIRDSLEGRMAQQEQEVNRLLGEMRKKGQAAGALEDELKEVRRDRDSLNEQFSSREGELAVLRDREAEISERLHQTTEDYVDLRDQVARADWRILEVVHAEGRIWETRVDKLHDLPRFRRASSDSAHIISVLNLKGGVGKSTIAANLGATFRLLGRRVLLLDLDFQGSLTSLCLDARKIHYFREHQQFIQRLFRFEDPSLGELRKCLTSIDRKAGEFDLLATDDGLADYEERLMATWLMGKAKHDIRFRLRRLLHDDVIQRKYDVVIIDCPPRHTTASINGLACSDYVLVPTLLDETSAEAVPRLLASLFRLKNLGPDTPLCPDLNVLGVVANMVAKRESLTTDEMDCRTRLREKCQDRWRAPVHIFEQHIPNKKEFAIASRTNNFAIKDPEVREIFTGLARELDDAISRKDSGGGGFQLNDLGDLSSILD